MNNQTHHQFNTDLPRVAILLATFNGELYLKEQLASIARQHGGQFSLIVSDDGSSDQTHNYLHQFKKENPAIPVRIVKGPGRGFAENFRFLIQTAATDFDYYAFCDQDDIWMDSKIAHSIAALTGMLENTAALYCGRTNLIDSSGKIIGNSPLFARAPSFSNALVQSIAGGNTMTLNAFGFKILQEVSKTNPFISHDWFAYQVISAVGGSVIFDDQPQIYYRQHKNNVIGKNTGIRAKCRRLVDVFNGRYKYWGDINLNILEVNRALFNVDVGQKLLHFQRARNGNVFARLYALHQSRVYRQTLTGTISLWVACVFGKL